MLESHLLAPFILALFVNKRKIRLILNCRWLFVDVVQRHTTENVYPGNMDFKNYGPLFISVDLLFSHLVFMLPITRKIAFEEDEDAGVEQRAWEGLLVDRILIYCL